MRRHESLRLWCKLPPMRFFLLLLLLFSAGLLTSAHSGVVLNEIQAANRSTIRDEDGDASDWVEIFNASDQAVDLDGWGLSDDPKKPGKWAFPERVIEPGGRLLVWASDKDRKGETLHAPFALKQKGETVVLTDAAGEEVDRIAFGPQTEDRSWGRSPDGGEWGEIEAPTPNGPNLARTALAVPIIHPDEGFHDGPLQVEISDPLGEVEIRYTTDGSPPNETSPLYTAPFPVDRTTVVRARSLSKDGTVSGIATKTYLLEGEGRLPSLSLVAAPEDLWDASRGLLSHTGQRGDDWEREASVEFFDPDGKGFSLSCGLRIHGGISRSFEKNSFRLYFSSGYGPDRLEYPLFPDGRVDSFKRLILSGGSNDSAMDSREIHSAVWTLLRDALMNELFREAGVPAVGQRPVRLYLNGKPWGIYWIKERIDKYFVEDHFGYSDFDLLKHDHTVETVEGSLDRWNALNRFLRTHPLNLELHYSQLLRWIDLDNFIDNHILEMWGGNIDWPHNNHYQLHPGTETGRWIWIPWDNDVVLGSPYVVFADYDMHRHVSGRHRLKVDWSTLHFRCLLGNESFRTRFVERTHERMESVLDRRNVQERIAQLAENLRPDIAFETDRWGSSPEEWEKNVDQLIRFVKLRDKAFREHTQAFAVRTRDPAHQGSVGVLRAFAAASEADWTASNLFEFALRQGE